MSLGFAACVPTRTVEKPTRSSALRREENDFTAIREATMTQHRLRMRRTASATGKLVGRITAKKK
jgi:hypothetical protein